MDPLWIITAFALGFAARQLGLPPLVGFLGAGFILNALGAQGGEIIAQVADLGVYMLLFSIGLKLNLRSLLRPEIWAVATSHMAATVIIFTLFLMTLGSLGLSLLADVNFQTALLLSFALSFSSTVFAVKILEEKGEMASLQGRVAIGILIMQDIFAILFMTFSTGKIPTPWALLLLGLPFLRPWLIWLMNRCGHGELLVLLGLLFSLGGAKLFSGVGLKPDLGPLVLGIILGGHPKASELSKTLLGFKDLFLTGFFLSIGLSGIPTGSTLAMAALLVLVMPFKVALFYWLLTRFSLRSHSSFLTSLSLANYSEFGLIVGAVGLSNGWIDGVWLIVIALALSLTFILASPLNSMAHLIYQNLDRHLKRFERPQRLEEEQPVDLGDAQILIVGMGRIGAGAYDEMRKQAGNVVLGLDFNPAVVARNQQAGRKVLLGDPTAEDFRSRIQKRDQIRLIMLTLPKVHENLEILRHLKQTGFTGPITAVVQYDDQVETLKQAGIDAVHNVLAEAGCGYARHTVSLFPKTLNDSPADSGR